MSHPGGSDASSCVGSGSDAASTSSRESVLSSSQGCQASASAVWGGTTHTPLPSERSNSSSVSTASAGSPSTTVSSITSPAPSWSGRPSSFKCKESPHESPGHAIATTGCCYSTVRSGNSVLILPKSTRRPALLLYVPAAPSAPASQKSEPETTLPSRFSPWSFCSGSDST